MERKEKTTANTVMIAKSVASEVWNRLRMNLSNRTAVEMTMANQASALIITWE